LTARLTFESGASHVLKMHNAATFARVRKSARILNRSLPVVTPERTGRSKRHRTMAYRWISGVELDISMHPNGARETMEWIFEFLDRLHCPIDNVNNSLEFRSPVAGVRSVAEYLALIAPATGSMARKICDDILSNQDHDFRPTLVHGDFHERQVIVAQARRRVCDFDNCGLGDPGSDLANFVGHLQYRALLGEIGRDPVDQIHEWSMRHAFGGGGRRSMLRYRWNCVAAMLRLATNPFRSGSCDWKETTDRCLSAIIGQIELIKRDCNAATSSSPAAMAGPGTARWVDISQSPIPRSSKSNQMLRDDPSFEFLASACDPESAERVLKRQIPRSNEMFGDFEVARVAVLRHKPGRRCLIEFELSTEIGTRSILGKASTKRLDRRALEAQSKLFQDAGFGYENDDHISVPRPLGCWAPWKMWFQEKVDATEGVKFLDDNLLNSVTDRIALAMAKLHSSGCVPETRHSLSDEMRILDKRLNLAKTSLPMFARRIERVRRNCFAIADSIRPAVDVPVHRDFYHDQVLFGDRQTYLVDLDLFALGHPSLDVGNFLAHLTEYGIRHFGDPDHWIQAEHDIANHYLSRGPQANRAAIAAFKAISFARHIAISWTIPDRRKHVSTIIDIAEKLTTCDLKRLTLARSTDVRTRSTN
jgi:aminoglycoside phosphotransferase (APT) family kinase protein